MVNSSLIAPMLENFREFPEKTAYILIQDDNREEAVSFETLRRYVRSAAEALAQGGVRKGDIVILALRHSHQLIAAFWAAQFIGATPSIFPYPAPMQNQKTYLDNLANLVQTSGAKATVIMTGLEEYVADMPPETAGRFIMADEAFYSTPASNAPIAPTPAHGEDIAYIQYTSGSTGLQKGVMLSHRAILNFSGSFAQGIGFRDGDIVVNWLPLYHDFGLFAGFVVPLIRRYTTILLSPFKWVRNPRLLLEVITRYKATMCWMPNFGFNHTVRSIPDSRLEGMDLGSLRSMGSGGEPIQYGSLQKFTQYFQPIGFSPSAMTAGYGMAENTLTVSISPPHTSPSIDWIDSRTLARANRAVPAPPESTGALPVVSCGPPVPGVEVRILDEDANILPERHKGQIVIRSDSLFSGYHQRPELTDRVLVDGWYHTGDMGYLADGELCVTGRMKDLIIVGGENIHPEDLEVIAASIPGVQEDRSVAFGVYDEAQGTDRIVMICNVKRTVAESEKAGIEKALRRKIREEMGLTLGEVRLVDNGWIVKTHNGKLARNANREKYLAEIAEKDT